MQFVKTELASKVSDKFIDMTGGFVAMEMVIKGKLYGKPFLHPNDSKSRKFYDIFLGVISPWTLIYFKFLISLDAYCLFLKFFDHVFLLEDTPRHIK